jgi:predicted nuclease with TOPRIM domain
MKEETLYDRRNGFQWKPAVVPISESVTSSSPPTSSSPYSTKRHHKERLASGAIHTPVAALSHRPLPHNALDQALLTIIAASIASPSDVETPSLMASPFCSPLGTLSAHLRREYGPVPSPPPFAAAGVGDTGDQHSVQSEYSSSTAAMLIESDAIWNTVTALVKERVQVEQQKQKDKLRRTLKRMQQRLIKTKGELQKAQYTNQQLIHEKDELQRGLEFEQQKNLTQQATQRRATERKDRLLKSTDRLRNRIVVLEEEKVTWQREREELTQRIHAQQQQLLLQQQQQQPFDSLETSAFTHSVDEISTVATTTTATAYSSDEYLNDTHALDLSTIVESPSTSRDEGQEFKELILHSELDEAKQKLRFEEKLLKLKNDEMAELESVFQKVASELESMHEKVQRKEEELFFVKEDVQRQQGSHQYLTEQNNRLQANVEILEGRLESEQAKMALQEAFVDSLKSQIYMGHEGQHKQAEEITRLRALVESQQRQADDRLLQLSKQRGDRQGHIQSIGDDDITLKGGNLSQTHTTMLKPVDGKNNVSQEMGDLLVSYGRSQREIRSLKDELERIMEENEIALRDANDDKQAFTEAAMAEINRLNGIRDRLQRKNYKQKQTIIDLKARLGIVDGVTR